MSEKEKIEQNIEEESEFETGAISDELSGDSRPVKLHSVQAKGAEDVVANKYLVLHKTPLKDFHTEHAKAFAISDNETGEILNHIYALVFDKTLPQRITAMTHALRIHHDNLCNVLYVELVYLNLNKEMNLVVIVEKPTGITLRDYYKKFTFKNLKDRTIIYNIIQPLVNVISDLHANSITHGCINPDTIYIADENLNIKVNHCIGELCGMKQIPIYETVDNMQADKYGKNQHHSVDYYAVGMLLSYLLNGPNQLESNISEAIEIKLVYGSYNLCFAKKKAVEFRDLAIGLLIDKNIERWDYNKIKDWINGRKFGLVVPNEYIDSGRSMIFNGMSFSNCRHLAYHLGKNWELAKAFIKDSDTFFKWIERNVEDDHRTSLLIQAQRMSFNSIIKNNFSDSDQYLCRSLIVLDPEAPINIKNTKSDARSLGNMIAYALNKDIPEILYMVGTLLDNNILEGWNEAAGATGQAFSIQEMAYYRFIASNYSKNSVGFGVERILYDLNPNLPCQSKLIARDYVLTIDDALSRLEAIAASGVKNLIDKHVIAFIASRLQLPSEINIRSLARFPHLGKSMNMQSVAILGIAQKRIRKNDLKNLAENLSALLNEYIDEMHGKKIKEEMHQVLETIVKEGNINKMITVITDAKFLVRDQVGYVKAKTRYNRINKQLSHISNRPAIYNSGYKYGLKITVGLSYVLAAIVVIGLIAKYNF